MADMKDIAPVLEEVVGGIKALYGDRFAGLILFGSYARGEVDEGSDIDLLLLLHGPVDVLAEIRRMLAEVQAFLQAARDYLEP